MVFYENYFFEAAIAILFSFAACFVLKGFRNWGIISNDLCSTASNATTLNILQLPDITQQQ